ncbi:divergent AAA domain protein [bacterium BMS3Abin01]|nr:divergent AAA domain protein [bacterium BMS3Abin01]
MSETVFKQVNYDLASLIKYIELGEIGLPDIQRPFVWKNAKVRDLFDSMYQGYPVGYLLFWQNGLAEHARSIGTEPKQKPPRLLIVDGQQRLTSLYAVIKQIPVVRESYTNEPIHIAFNPLEEKFEVSDAAIRRDKSYIPDISVLWNSDTDLFEIVDDYLAELQSSREVCSEEEKQIKRAISKLQTLLSFPLTALELSANISEEDVAEVFVRINSKGVTLNQADFILTLMSVFWDEGRSRLENFCRQAREPSDGEASSFNHFIKPDPDQLLRVCIGLGFKRARLKYVYSLLRGKDLETEEFSDERRVEQFEILKKAQTQVLDLQHWQDFMNCLRMAGYRSSAMIGSKNNLLFSYILYLLGKTEYGVEEFRLRRVVSRWFFMSSLTGRFSGSPESAMEFDLARFRQIDDADSFVNILERVCDLELTEDYWKITLPNDLATSSPRSPSLFAYNAALVLLDARALFSKLKIADLLDPATQGSRKSVERHHLFPKGYLATLGITSLRDTNQIANYAYVEWGDNTSISDQAPEEYLPEYESRFGEKELKQMYHWHALPAGWEKLEYRDFLERRRELIAGIIEEGYKSLTAEPADLEEETPSIDDLIADGESSEVEFKATMRVNLHTGQKDPRMELAILRTIAGFLNASGGTLMIGITDDGTAQGIDADGFANEDKMSLHLVNLVKNRMGATLMTYVHPRFEDYNSSRVMVIDCSAANAPVFVKDGNVERFYIRTGPSTTELSASQTQEFIQRRF